MTRKTAATRLLARHFFRRFFDNDLVSPHGDGHENLALVFAALAVPGLFVSGLLVFEYFNPLDSPAQRMLFALDHKFLCLACSMIVMALVTLVEWDALALDARDLAILGPLPIERGVLVRANLGALALFVAAFAVAVNAIPIIVYPVLLAGNLPISLARVLWLMIVHAATAVAAGAFAFLAFLALREVLRSLLGARLFRRVSVVVQFVSVLALVTALLLLPGLSSNISSSVLSKGGLALYLSPPMWFLGLYETLSAGAVLGAAGVDVPRRFDLWRIAADRHARSVYLGHEAVFHELAGIALAALAIAGIVAIGGYALHARHVGQPSVSESALRRWVRRTASFVAARLVVRHPVAQAGFFFTLQTLARSASHRLYMAGWLSVAFAVSVVMVAPVDVRQALQLSATPRRLLALQMVLSFFLLAGLRVVFTVPAELRANWAFQVCWAGDFKRYLTGVRRAVGIAIVLPLFAALVPLHALLWGSRIAAVHLACGWLASLILVEALLLHFRKLPFTCSYLSGKGNLRMFWPLYLLTFATYTYGFASLERLALETGGRSTAMVVGLCTVLGALVAYRHWLFRRRPDIIFDEPPEPATQALGLSG